MAETDTWDTSSDEEEADDLFFEEEGDEESKRKKKEEAQHEMNKAGMLLVAGPEWKENLRERLTEAITAEAAPAIDWKNVFEMVERAGKATCYVRRLTNSQTRLERLAKKNDEKGLAKANKGICGGGTGFLMSPKSKYGWLVITNNHVIMDEEEAKSAEVLFDHLDDDSLAKTKRIKVKQLLSKDIPTESATDLKSLDFSVLLLESAVDDEHYLKESASIDFEETARVNVCAKESFLKSCDLQFIPIIAFHHPHGLGKRLSIGKYPGNCENYPTTHIKHELPTASGSSGANLIYCYSGKFDSWWACFLHYRHHKAVAWQAIGPLLRKDFASLT